MKIPQFSFYILFYVKSILIWLLLCTMCDLDESPSHFTIGFQLLRASLFKLALTKNYEKKPAYQEPVMMNFILLFFKSWNNSMKYLSRVLVGEGCVTSDLDRVPYNAIISSLHQKIISLDRNLKGMKLN